MVPLCLLLAVQIFNLARAQNPFDLLNDNNFKNVVGTVSNSFDTGIDMAQEWLKYQINFAKNYTMNESPIRFEIFKKNFQMIQEHNQKFLQGLQTFKIALNHFADLTKEEFIQTLKLKPPRRFKRGVKSSDHSGSKSDRIYRQKRQLPNFMNWRNTGAVTPVKNQGDCGSCWSFSTIGSLESQLFLKTNKNTPLSEQHLIDCNVDDTNVGCVGGWMANAYEYLRNNFVTSESEYPYQSYQQQCPRDRAFGTKVSITGYQTLSGTEESLKEAIALIGPVAAALDASNLQFYDGGVFRDEDCSPSIINHGVVVIGYGNEGGRDYWLVKNSWGTEWGEDGFFKIIRNKNNQCNLATYAMYPIIG